MDYHEYRNKKTSFSRRRERLEMARDELRFLYDQRSLRPSCSKNWDARIQGHLTDIRRMEFLLFNSKEEWSEHCERQEALNNLDRLQQFGDYEDEHMSAAGSDRDLGMFRDDAQADASEDNKAGIPISLDGDGGDITTQEYIDLQDLHTSGAKKRRFEQEQSDRGELPSRRERPSSAVFYFDPPLGGGQDRPRGHTSFALPGKIEHEREPSIARSGDTRGEKDMASSAPQALVPYRPRSISQALTRRPVLEEDSGRSYDGRPRIATENYPARDYQTFPVDHPREVYREEPRMYVPRGGAPAPVVYNDEAPRYYVVDRVPAQREYILPESTYRPAYFVPRKTELVHYQPSGNYARPDLHYQGYRDDSRIRAPSPAPPGRVESPAYTESASRLKSPKEGQYGSEDDPVHLETRVKRRRISVLD